MPRSPPFAAMSPAADRRNEPVKRRHAVDRARDADACFPLNIAFRGAWAEPAGDRALQMTPAKGGKPAREAA